MKDTFEKIEGLTDNVKEYVSTNIELARLNIAEKTSMVIGNLIAVSVVAILFLFVIIFGSIAGAYVISDLIGKPYTGFLIVAGFYLLLGIVIWVTRERFIQSPVMNTMIKQLLKKDEEDVDK